jgi:hypothetical protein
VAGAGGFEPPDGGIKIRCLTTWRRPNVPQGVLGLAESGRTIVRALARRNGWQGGFALAPSRNGGASFPTLRERRQIGVGAADENADPLVSFGPIGAAGEGGEGRCAAGLGDN